MRYLVFLIILSGCSVDMRGARIDRLQLQVSDFVNGFPAPGPEIERTETTKVIQLELDERPE